MLGQVCWLEVNSPDAEGAKRFYGGLFGWQEGPGDVGFPYHFLKTAEGEKNFGGIMPQRDGAAPPHWLVYFAVADLDEALANVKRLGGQAESPIVEMPVGRFAVVSDPDGAVFAMFQNIPSEGAKS